MLVAVLMALIAPAKPKLTAAQKRAAIKAEEAKFVDENYAPLACCRSDCVAGLRQVKGEGWEKEECTSQPTDER